MSRRLAAITSLLLLAASVVLAVVLGVQSFPRGLTVLACLAGASLAAWWALIHRGAARFAAAAGTVVLLAGAVVLVALEGRLLEDALVLVGIALSVAAARRVFDVHTTLPPASAPKQPVLFYNPKSGGGKAERFEVAREARARGVEPVELHLGDDLATLVHDAIADGADADGVAGGAGTQAIVAAIAAERGLPYVCVPAGTRNHFALDLGVDRDDVVGALDAFTNGRERVVDVAGVNGRVFVNNVSLGVYAEAVQRHRYRDAKLRTIAETMPTVLGPDGHALDLRFAGTDGHEHKTSAVVLVSNDPYRLGRAIASGTRPRLDMGVLGITVLQARANRNGDKRVQQWSAPSVPGQLRRSGRSGDRRRSAKARTPAAVSHQTRSPARADRAATPGRLTIRGHAGKPVGRDSGRRSHRHARLFLATPAPVPGPLT